MSQSQPNPPNPNTIPEPGAAWWVRLLAVRLRFPLILALAILVVGRWDALGHAWERMTRTLTGRDAGAVSNDIEYFCPMDPGVRSDFPSKCSICNMVLVRRKKGDVGVLPTGVVARMQLSPYRITLAGLRTTAVGYQRLTREVEVRGLVVSSSPTRIEGRLLPGDRSCVVVGQSADIRGEGPDPLKAVVRSVDPARRICILEAVEDELKLLTQGQTAIATIQVDVSTLEPFRSLPSDAPPRKLVEPRVYFLDPNRPGLVYDTPGRGREEIRLSDNQRLRWWCPMHPNIVSERPGVKCEPCKGMALVPRVMTYRPPGEVLAIPESAVVRAAGRSVVFVERMPGMFDATEVELGPRCGDAYPVAKGLEAGQRIVTVGAFLLDAETRLDPSLAAAYFGASRSTGATPAPETPKAKLCPVTGARLGSMGAPYPVKIRGRTVELCCKACEPDLRADPEKYLGAKPTDPSK